ncbi:MAG TPA: hypothetical protein G4N91_01950 [Dehalococcoidia bacterium]|nr:hypothetical protein [Dehalococcoidia bacterium]
MEQREKLLEEREKLKTEYTKRHKTWMDAFNKRNDLLPKFHDAPFGVKMAELTPTTESLVEYDKADKEEREASAKARETLARILEINAILKQ